MFEYYLTGNANSGKTTLYNALCKADEKTGNWHGVTAVVKKSGYMFDNEKFLVSDLPGIYSLNPVSLEEKNSVDAIKSVKEQLIVVVIDINSLQSGIKLCKDLLKEKLKFTVVLTKTQRKKMSLINKCERIFGIKCFCVNAYDRKSVKAFKESVKNLPIVTEIKDEKIEQNNFKSIDKIFLNSFFNLVFFIVFSCVALYCSIGKYSLGSFLSDKLNSQTENFSVRAYAFLNGRVTELVRKIIVKGVIEGIGSVLSFIPQIFILNFFISLYEESGFAERTSCCVGVSLSKLGLGVKCLFPLVSGLTCTGVSCELCNSCENEKIKKRTMDCLSFVPCSAKNATLIYLCKTFFAKPFIAIISLYVLQVFIIVFLAVALKLIYGVQRQPLIKELDCLRFPPVSFIFKRSFKAVGDFVKKVGIIITLISVSLTLFTAVNANFSFCENLSESLLAFVAKKISFVFYPLGIYDWRYSVGAICGFFAKEGVIGACSSLNLSRAGLSFASRFSYCVFISLYSPCFVALASFKKESNFAFSLKIFIRNTLIGYIGGFLCYKTLNKNYLSLIIFLIAVIIITAVLYGIKKRNGRKTRVNFGNSSSSRNRI